MSQGEFIAIVGACILFGPAMAIWPYEFAKFTETIDAIGRKPAGKVEPAEWNSRTYSTSSNHPKRKLLRELCEKRCYGRQSRDRSP